MPLDVSILASFYAHLYTSGKKFSTILTYVSALAFYHKIRNQSDPSANFYIKKILHGIKNDSPKPDLLAPITKQLLHRILDVLHLYSKSHYETLAVKAVLLCGYYACLRIGEIVICSDSDEHTLKMSNVKAQLVSGRLLKFMIKLDSFKHSRIASPWLVMSREKDEENCPVQALVDYLLIRPHVPGLFFVTEHGLPFKRIHIANVLKASLEHIGLDSASYNCHSLRIGRATDLSMMGKSDEYIRAVGRWSSDAYLKYIRPQVLLL